MTDRRKSQPDLVEVAKMLSELSEKVNVLDVDLESLSNRFDEHERTEAEKLSKVIDAIAENTESLRTLVLKTQTVIDISQNAEGFLNTTKYIGNFLIWCGKFGTLGGAIVFAFIAIKNKMGF